MQAEERKALLQALTDLVAGNKQFINTSIVQLSDLFAEAYAGMSKSFSSDIPSSILNLDKPLFPDQADRTQVISVKAGSIHQYPISVKVCNGNWLINQ